MTRHKTNGRAIGYCRVSTEQQRESGLGLDAQRATLEQTAERLGLRLVDIHTDAGMSGTLTNRPALAAALNDLRRGDVLLIAKRDRLARDTFQAVAIERQVSRKGARILSCAGEGTESDDATAVFCRRILDAVAELESALAGVRTRAANHAKRARGHRAGRLEPYGYRVNGDGKTLHPYEPEQRIVTLMQDCAEAGYSQRAIADELNRQGFTTRAGKPWRHQYVASALDTQRQYRQAREQATGTPGTHVTP